MGDNDSLSVNDTLKLKSVLKKPRLYSTLVLCTVAAILSVRLFSAGNTHRQVVRSTTVLWSQDVRFVSHALSNYYTQFFC